MPPKNLTGTSAKGAGGVCAAITVSTWGMPLPAASGEKRRTRKALSAVAAAAQPTMRSNPFAWVGAPHRGQGEAKPVGRVERDAEQPADEPGAGAADDGENRQREKAGAVGRCRHARSRGRRRKLRFIGLGFKL